MPGASPETMATSVATPLERHLGEIADVTEMTSSSSVGIDPHHAAIRPRPRHRRRGARRAGGDQRRARRPAGEPAQQPDLPQGQPGRRADPDPGADLRHADPGPDLRRGLDRPQQKLSQVDGVGEVDVGGSSLPAVRVELNPRALFKYGIGLEDVRAALAAANANSPKGAIEHGDQPFQIYANDQARQADAIPRAGRSPIATARRCGSPTSPTSIDFGREHPQCRARQRQAVGAGDPLSPARRQHHRHRRPGEGAAAAAAGLDLPRDIDLTVGDRPHHHDPRLAARRRAHAGDRHRPGDPGGLPVPAQRRARR